MAVSRIDEAGLNVTQYGNRNLLINGAMTVAQRGTSTAIGNAYKYSPDRFFASAAQLDEYVGTVSQESDAPDGFSNSLKITTTTVETTLDANEYLYIGYEIEAQDLQHINYGSSAAKEMTLSFWVKSSITGTYCVGVYATDATRILNVPYTIDAANTWEYKTLKIVGDTGGTGIVNDNGAGLRLAWTLASGSDFSGTDSTSWISYVAAAWSNSQTTNTFLTTASSTFFLTGVQLEVGDTATAFEHRSYGDELARCLRYFNSVVEFGGSGVTAWLDASAYSSGQNYGTYTFPVPMRAAPTFSYSSLSDFSTRFGNNITPTTITTHGSASTRQVSIRLDGTSTAGQAGWFEVKNSDGYIYLDSEL